MHAKEWYQVAEKVADARKAHKRLFVRDTECQFCQKKVYGVERHALQCPVLFQACFMSCLAKAPSVEPNIWHRLRDLTRESCHLYLQGSLQITQDVSEPLNRFCVLCARQNTATSIMDIQAWRKHLQQVHGVTKTVLTTQFHEQAALVNISRPCAFCRMPFQKSPKLHRSKCLPLAQLLSVKHGYAGVCGVAVAKFRKREKGGGKGQITGHKRQEPPEEEEAGEQILVSQSELRTIRTLLVRHDQALNQLAVDRTYVLFFSTTDMSTLTMLRTVTNHWREQYTLGKCTTTLRAALLTSLWMEMEARLEKFQHNPAAIKVMVEKGLFLEAPGRWAYTAWNQQEKKAQVTDQPHLSSDELKAAIKTLRAAAMTDKVIRKFAPMQKLGENITAQAVVFTLVLSTRARAERVHTEMTKLINSAALSLIGLRLRPEKLQLSPLAKALAGPRS